MRPSGSWRAPAGARRARRRTARGSRARPSSAPARRSWARGRRARSADRASASWSCLLHVGGELGHTRAQLLGAEALRQVADGHGAIAAARVAAVPGDELDAELAVDREIEAFFAVARGFQIYHQRKLCTRLAGG